MADRPGLRELLEAGVHFGHQTRRWNPKMRRFIHGERDGIYIIDLLKTEAALRSAEQFVSELSHRGGVVLFVGTKSGCTTWSGTRRRASLPSCRPASAWAPWPTWPSCAPTSAA